MNKYILVMIITVFITVLYFILSVVIQNEIVIRKKEELKSSEIRDKTLAVQIPSVILFNLSIVSLIVFWIYNDFFETYFWDNPFSSVIMVLTLFLLTYNSLYALLYKRFIFNDQINFQSITLPLWSFAISFLFVISIMLISVSVNPAEWFLVIKGMF